MTPEEHTRRIRGHYLPLLQQHGATFRAVDWGSSRAQELRFQVLLEVGNCERASILDVGCGVGHLADRLPAHRLKGTYVGIDILPEMIGDARKRHPGLRFLEGDIMDVDAKWTAEYVVGSGLFTFSDDGLMKQTVAAMFAACAKAVAFNALSTWAEGREPGEFHADPLTTVDFCRTLTPWVTLRHDYMQQDFTIYMYREAIRA